MHSAQQIDGYFKEREAWVLELERPRFKYQLCYLLLL